MSKRHNHDGIITKEVDTDHDGIITKGAALIKAREILGPGAIVKVYEPNGDLMAIIGTACFIGKTWEQVLTQAKESPEARAWNARQIEDANKVEKALDSLKKARQAHFTTSLSRVAELTKSRFQKIRVRATGYRRCGGCGKKISANKNHCAACPPQLRPELPNTELREVQA